MVTDDGTTVTLATEGYDETDTVRVPLTVSVSAPVPTGKHYEVWDPSGTTEYEVWSADGTTRYEVWIPPPAGIESVTDLGNGTAAMTGSGVIDLGNGKASISGDGVTDLGNGTASISDGS